MENPIIFDIIINNSIKQTMGTRESSLLETAGANENNPSMSYLVSLSNPRAPKVQLLGILRTFRNGSPNLSIPFPTIQFQELKDAYNRLDGGDFSSFFKDRFSQFIAAYNGLPFQHSSGNEYAPGDSEFLELIGLSLMSNVNSSLKIKPIQSTLVTPREIHITYGTSTGRIHMDPKELFRQLSQREVNIRYRRADEFYREMARKFGGEKQPRE